MTNITLIYSSREPDGYRSREIRERGIAKRVTMTGVTLAVWWSRTFVGNVICNQYEIQKGGFENRFVGPKITR